METKRTAHPFEGYSIVAEPEKVTITYDERGCLYGAYALLARIQKNGAKWIIPCGMEEDWPDLETRAVCIEMLPPPMRDIDFFKRYLFALARARTNTVIFFFYPDQIDGWINKRKQEFWTEDEVAELRSMPVI